MQKLYIYWISVVKWGHKTIWNQIQVRGTNFEALHLQVMNPNVVLCLLEKPQWGSNRGRDVAGGAKSVDFGVPVLEAGTGPSSGTLSFARLKIPFVASQCSLKNDVKVLSSGDMNFSAQWPTANSGQHMLLYPLSLQMAVHSWLMLTPEFHSFQFFIFPIYFLDVYFGEHVLGI